MRRMTGGASSGLNLIIFGALIVLVTCTEPRGIMGIVDRIRQSLAGRKKVGE